MALHSLRVEESTVLPVEQPRASSKRPKLQLVALGATLEGKEPYDILVKPQLPQARCWGLGGGLLRD